MDCWKIAGGMRLQAKTVLVVGASSGLGLAVARETARAGHRVFAAARGFAGQQGASPEGYHCLAIDVTDEASIGEALREVERLAGAVDVLILCAARIMLGSCEDTSEAELRAVLDTNFLGMVRVIHAVLPAMRAHGGGLIVPFSSLNGLMATPFTSAYVASKHAVEGWCECLRMECSPFGVRVCVVRPGDHRSGNSASRQRAARAQAPDSPYAAACAHGTATIARDEAGGSSPQHLGRAVARLIARKHPSGTFTVARLDQRLASWLHDLLPARAFAWVLRLYYLGRVR